MSLTRGIITGRFKATRVSNFSVYHIRNSDNVQQCVALEAGVVFETALIIFNALYHSPRLHRCYSSAYKLSFDSIALIQSNASDDVASFSDTI